MLYAFSCECIQSLLFMTISCLNDFSQVKEHLEIFADLKGVPEDSKEKAVTEMVDEVSFPLSTIDRDGLWCYIFLNLECRLNYHSCTIYLVSPFF